MEMGHLLGHDSEITCPNRTDTCQYSRCFNLRNHLPNYVIDPILTAN